MQCLTMQQCFYRGEGISLNKEESIKYFKMAADEGNPNAMFNYAVIL